LVGILNLYRSLAVVWHVRSELYKNRNSKAERYETLVRKLKEINLDADREVITKHAESLIENHCKQFKNTELNTLKSV
jgi:hypothetical protein